MKQVKMMTLIMLTLIMVIFAGCGASGNPNDQVQAPVETSAEAQDADTSRLKGTIGEIKDFMFVVTDKDGNAYSFSFETKPEGLDDVAEGDNVIVEYTGDLNQVDAFDGQIISIRKAY